MKYLALCLSVVAAAQAGAATTPVNPSPASEASHLTILNNVYGDTFSASGLDFNSTGGLTATRVDDADDQTFSVGSFSARGVAKFGSYKQTFGWSDPGGAFQELFEIVGSGFAVTGDVSNVDPGNSLIAFGRGGTKGPYSSIDTANPFDADQLVTYKITGLDGEGETWLLFWEDETLNKSDRDFNDMVVEVMATSAIPLPAAALTGLATLAVTGAVGYLRRRRRTA